MDTSDRPLQGKVALVTGAGRGIGRAIASAYADAGASVGCSARTLSEIEDTVADITGRGGQAIAVQADVTQIDSVKAMVDSVPDAFGGLDIVVINAGANYNFRAVDESDSEKWKATIDVNLLGAYYCAKMAIPALKKRGGGVIITIGSGAGHRGRAGMSAYACAKAGLWMLTRVMAQELWEFNISVNELIPGPVKTGFSRHRPEDVKMSPRSDVNVEWRKTPEDVVPLAIFLATQPQIGPSARSFSLMRRDT